jgi:hypothetical protein
MRSPAVAGAGETGRTPSAWNGDGNPVVARSGGAVSDFWRWALRAPGPSDHGLGGSPPVDHGPADHRTAGGFGRDVGTGSTSTRYGNGQGRGSEPSLRDFLSGGGPNRGADFGGPEGLHGDGPKTSEQHGVPSERTGEFPGPVTSTAGPEHLVGAPRADQPGGDKRPGQLTNPSDDERPAESRDRTGLPLGDPVRSEEALPLRVPDREQWVAAEIAGDGRKIRFRPGDVISAKIGEGEHSVGVSFLRRGAAPFMGAWAKRGPVYTVRTLPGEAVHEAVKKRLLGGQWDTSRPMGGPSVHRSIVLETEGDRDRVTVYLPKGARLGDGTVLDRDTAIRTDGEGYGHTIRYARAFQELYRRHPGYDLLHAVCFIADAEVGQRLASTMRLHGVGNKIWVAPDVLTTGRVTFRNSTTLDYIGIANNKPWVAFVGGARRELAETAYTDAEVRVIREQEAARQDRMPGTESIAHPAGDRTGAVAPSADPKESPSTVDDFRPMRHIWYDHWSDADASQVADAERRANAAQRLADREASALSAAEQGLADAERRVADAEWRAADAERRVAAAAREESVARAAAGSATAELGRWQAEADSERWYYGTLSRATRQGLRDAERRDWNAAGELRQRGDEYYTAQQRSGDAAQEQTNAVWAADVARRTYQEAQQAADDARRAAEEAWQAVDAARQEADRRAAEAQAYLETELETTPLIRRFVGEDIPGYLPEMHPSGVRYLTPDEREAYRIHIGSDGLLYDSAGNLYHVRGANGVQMFVVDRYGRIYAGRAVSGRFHHGSFLAGGDVAAAGEWRVFHGRIMRITDDSGHYLPHSRFLRQFVALLRRQGVPVFDSAIEYVSAA